MRFSYSYSLNIASLDSMKPNPFNFIFFQDHPPIPPIETSLIILSVFRNGYLSKSLIQIYRIVFMLSLDFLYFHHTLFISKHSAFYKDPEIIEYIPVLPFLTISSIFIDQCSDYCFS